DVELSPAAVRDLGAADLVLRIGGFQPAVDDAVASTGVRTFDASQIVALHAEEHHDDGEDGHHHGEVDPHFWLDPLLLADYADALAAELVGLAPEHAHEFQANAAQLREDLERLDRAYADALASCEQREIVTSH